MISADKNNLDLVRVKAQTLIDSAPWIRKFQGQILVIKFGGNAMVDEALQQAFAEDIAYLQLVGIKPVVVHGGGPQISAQLAAAGIESKFVDGLRVTTAESIGIIRDTLRDEISVPLAKMIETAGANTMVLNGESEGLFTASVTRDDLGLVGVVTSVNSSVISKAIAQDLVPVISTVGPDDSGQLLNVNADLAASSLAVALGAAKLVVLTDVAGLYSDWPNKDSLVSEITLGELEELLPDLESGMIPKMGACLAAVSEGVPQAHIIDGRIPHSVLLEIFTPSGIGTLVLPQVRKINMTRHFLKDDDISALEQADILQLALKLKKDPYSAKPFAGPKTVAVIFDKTSTRTRVSFAVGIADLGGSPLIIDAQGSQLGVKESVADTARVLDRQVAQIVWRTYAQAGLVEMAENSNVPVINALSDEYHPCQLLADLLTVLEHKGKLAGLKLAYIGDGNNMANSYMLAGALAGMHVAIATPAAYAPDADVVSRATELAKQNGGSISVSTSVTAAVSDADVLATDTWVSMGQEAEKAERVKAFAGFSIDSAVLAQAKADAIVLHCLPAYRGYEISAEVLDGSQAVIWDEAENRLHAQKALMVWLDHHAK